VLGILWRVEPGFFRDNAEFGSGPSARDCLWRGIGETGTNAFNDYFEFKLSNNRSCGKRGGLFGPFVPYVLINKDRD
jgi:hypothetical protein